MGASNLMFVAILESVEILISFGSTLISASSFNSRSWYILYKLYFDGGARGNSAGAAGSGWVIYDHQDVIIKKGSQFLGFKDVDVRL